jgi:hypothetical protein
MPLKAADGLISRTINGGLAVTVGTLKLDAELSFWRH